MNTELDFDEAKLKLLKKPESATFQGQLSVLFVWLSQVIALGHRNITVLNSS